MFVTIILMLNNVIIIIVNRIIIIINFRDLKRIFEKSNVYNITVVIIL